MCVLRREALERSRGLYGSMLKDNGANRGYKHVVHPYNRASMLRHCLHALTVCHGSSSANDMNRDPHREIFGKWVKGLSCRAPFLSKSIFSWGVPPQTQRSREVFVNYCHYDDEILQILLHVVTIWCFLSCERLL